MQTTMNRITTYAFSARTGIKFTQTFSFMKQAHRNFKSRMLKHVQESYQATCRYNSKVEAQAYANLTGCLKHSTPSPTSHRPPIKSERALVLQFLHGCSKRSSRSNPPRSEGKQRQLDAAVFLVLAINADP